MKTFSPEHRAGIAAANTARAEAQRAARLEDITWLVETGESLTGAARRIGIGRESLRTWCHRWAPELGRTLADREPRDPNQRPGIEAMRTRRTA